MTLYDLLLSSPTAFRMKPAMATLTLLMSLVAASAHAGYPAQNIASMCAAKADGHEHWVALCDAGASSARAAFGMLAERVPPAKRTELGLYLSAADAAQMAKEYPAEVLFLDIRTREEVAFLGMPTIADANVPFMVMNPFGEWDERRNTYAMEVNSTFGTEVAVRLAQKGLDQSAPVLLICRSGDRSAKAANYLAQLGYKAVYSVIDGYEGDIGSDGRRSVNGWKNEGLPWNYRLDKAKMVLTR